MKVSKLFSLVPALAALAIVLSTSANADHTMVIT